MCTVYEKTCDIAWHHVEIHSNMIYVHQPAIFKIKRTPTIFMSKKGALVGRLLWIPFGGLQTSCESSKISLWFFLKTRNASTLSGNKHVDPLRNLCQKNNNSSKTLPVMVFNVILVYRKYMKIHILNKESEKKPRRIATSSIFLLLFVTVFRFKPLTPRMYDSSKSMLLPRYCFDPTPHMKFSGLISLWRGGKQMGSFGEYEQNKRPTVHGSEIRRSPVEVGSLSHYLQSLIHPRWLFRISAINSSKGKWYSKW